MQIGLIGIAVLILALIVLHVSGALPFRRQLAVGMDVTLLPVLFVLSVVINAAGLELLAPDKMGRKLSKLPGLWWLADSAPTYKLTVAYPWAVVVMIAVAVSWAMLVKIMLSPEPRRLSLAGWFDFPVDGCGRKEWFWRQVAVAILLADCVLFFTGIATDASLFAALVLTVLYGAVLVCAALAHATLWQKEGGM